MEHSVRISVENASKHVVLQPWIMAITSLHAVISFEMASFDGTIMVQIGAIGMRRMGVG